MTRVARAAARRDRPDIVKVLARLEVQARSDDWQRREAAGFAMRDLMEARFEVVYPATEHWVHHPSDRVRRAACLACMARTGKADRVAIRLILRRLEAVMADDSPYVRKCCGPFVVGFLGYTHPASTLPWLGRMARRRDLNVRTNTAKAFSQALGGRYPAEALTILTALASDGRARVRSAVTAASRNVLRRAAMSPRVLRRRSPALYRLLFARSERPTASASGPAGVSPERRGLSGRASLRVPCRDRAWSRR